MGREALYIQICSETHRILLKLLTLAKTAVKFANAQLGVRVYLADCIQIFCCSTARLYNGDSDFPQ